MAKLPCWPSDVSKAALDKALTTNRVSAIWRYAKANYIDAGASYEATLTGVANDIGMPRDFVARAFTKPKALRSVTKEVYRQQQARRDAIKMAKIEVATIDSPRAYKFLVAATSLPRRSLTFGHGPVFPVTHALDLLGSEWRTYLKTTADAWKFMSKAEHAKATDWLRTRDLYPTGRKAGLEIDPEKGPSGILIGGSGGWARRAWDSLKVARMNLFEDRWNNLPLDEQTPEMAKLLASQINHSTGVMSPNEWGFGVVSKGMFAPQLTASKIAKTIVDPAKTIVTAVKVATGQETTFAERKIAALRTRKAAQWIGSYVGLLAVNQAFNSMSENNDKINFTDPTRSDWMRPKAFGHTLNTRGTMELLRLAGNLVAITQASRRDLHGDTRTESARDALAKYAQYKMDPALQISGELALGEDVFGRPLPWTEDRGTASRPKYGWTEYGLDKGPIFLGGATREIYDSFREQGISSTDATSLIRALGENSDILVEAAAVGTMEFIGGGIAKAPEARPEKIHGSPFGSSGPKGSKQP